MNSLEFDQQQAKLPSKSRGPARIKNHYDMVKEVIASARTTSLPENVKFYSESLQLFDKTEVFEEF